jgi:multicomponent Na+:H+ antiporter subunit E
MARLITVLLRLLIWLLLSADLSTLNVLIGVMVALLLPMGRRHRALPPRLLLIALRDSLLAIPQAYAEALELLLRRRPWQERLERQAWSGQGASLLIFLEVFRITLTPLTIALGIEPGARACRVHRLVPQPVAMDDPGTVAVAPGQEARR